MSFSRQVDLCTHRSARHLTGKGGNNGLFSLLDDCGPPCLISNLISISMGVWCSLRLVELLRLSTGFSSFFTSWRSLFNRSLIIICFIFRTCVKCRASSSMLIQNYSCLSTGCLTDILLDLLPLFISGAFLSLPLSPFLFLSCAVLALARQTSRHCTSSIVSSFLFFLVFLFQFLKAHPPLI